jgi:hypothetical protein
MPGGVKRRRKLNLRQQISGGLIAWQIFVICRAKLLLYFGFRKRDLVFVAVYIKIRQFDDLGIAMNRNSQITKKSDQYLPTITL